MLHNRITPAQENAIVLGHAQGELDAELACRSGTSIATVKRVRARLGLRANCTRNEVGRDGEAYLEREAIRHGLAVSRPTPGRGKQPPFDLLIEERRVDVKTAQTSSLVRVRFRLPPRRASFHGRYAYAKNYERDCDVVALVALPGSGSPGGVVFVSSAELRNDVTLDLEAFRSPDWSLFTLPKAA